ncbi:MAG: ubiquinol oxidase subunit II [Hyphomicrobiales bacterium]|nr:ubiquinol oxidase subunit II [Hyphomicrobiales bacterium]
MTEKSPSPTGHARGAGLAPADGRPLCVRPAARFGVATLLGLVTFSLSGCSLIVLDPKGPIGKGDATILIDSTVVMLAIVVPTILATLAFAWWFRASNPRARRLPEFVYSDRVEIVTWSIPLLTIMLLGGVIWLGSHELDPATPLASQYAPLNVQVVSLDWKWLFIYPEQRVASVNRLVIPVGVPVHFKLTSGSVMNTFFVPQLGSMIYTMYGMESTLYLMADEPGTFLGESIMISGDGYPDMHFNVEAVTPDRFKAWVNETRGGGGETLTSQAYQDLAKQGVLSQPIAYSGVEEGLFHKITTQALPPGPGPQPEASPGTNKRQQGQEQ